MVSNQGVTLQVVKQLNKAKVQQFIYDKKETSRPEIAHELHMSLPTVTNCLAELEGSGLILKEGFVESTGGRKAQKVLFHATAKIAIGVELLKEYVRIAAIDLYGNVLNESITMTSFEDNTAYYEYLCEIIRSFIVHLPYSKTNVLGVGIAVQGLVSSDLTTLIYGKILNASSLSISKFRQYLGLPCILIHDAEAAANGEIWFLPQVQNAIYLSLNKNMGSSVIMNRTVQTGINRIGGTLEHVCMIPNGKLCYCGKRGCADTYCSAGAIMEESGMSLDTFFSALREGDSRCDQMWDRYLKNLALLLSNTRHTFDTDFIIGGLVSKYLSDVDYLRLNDLVMKNCPFDAPQLTWYRGKTDDRATVIGAALYYIRQFFSE